MELFKIYGIIIVSVVLIAFLRKNIPEYALLCAAACSMILLLYVFNFFVPVTEWLKKIESLTNLPNIHYLLKACGIALLTQSMMDLCKDGGMTMLAGKIDLIGRCMIILTSFPMLEEIMNNLFPFLK